MRRRILAYSLAKIKCASAHVAPCSPRGQFREQIGIRRRYKPPNYLVGSMAAPRGVEPPTFGLGNRFSHLYFKHLRPDVANVLHPFRRREIPSVGAYRQGCLHSAML